MGHKTGMPQLELEQTLYTMEQIADRVSSVDAPQVAVAGRSNVGKSSLINALAGRRSLAKISSTPGKTRSLNFYRAVPEGFYLVDLPGYGYAKISKAERAKWAELIEAYITGNERLAGVMVLLDSRLPPQQLDIDLVTFLDRSGIPVLPVFTKSDKPKVRERDRHAVQWQPLLGGLRPMPVSAKTGMNISKLWELLKKTTGTGA